MGVVVEKCTVLPLGILRRGFSVVGERERPPVCCLKSFFIGFGPLCRLRSNWRSRLQSLLQFALVPGWRGEIPPPVC